MDDTALARDTIGQSMLRGGAVLCCVVVAHVGQTEEEGMHTPVDLKVALNLGSFL